MHKEEKDLWDLGIFHQADSKGILLFFNDIVKTCQTFPTKWDLLIILNGHRFNLVMFLHSNNGHLKKEIGARHGRFKRHNVHKTFSEAAKNDF